MNVDELKRSGRIIFEAISGSHAYGTSTPKSDIDIRGFYVNPIEEYLTLQEPAGQIGDEKHDTTYYSLKKAFELLMKANPNMIELLWMPEDCVKVMSTKMEILIANRDLFISKKCFHSHSGYAYAQIDKAKGQNKKVHNPQPKERPKKEDFCWVWPSSRMDLDPSWAEENIFPSRPMSLNSVSEDGVEHNFDLSEYHAAALEHTSNVYRLYWYGDEAKGVFRGDDMLVCESIPKEDEHRLFIGLLIYNQSEYEKAIKDHKSYWNWKKNRNEARWIDQEKGKLNYDQKNMMHCMRLLMSGENILMNGAPLVRFNGDNLKYLMKIRSGELDYEDIMKEVEARMERFKELYDSVDHIPNKVNVNKIQELYEKLR